MIQFIPSARPGYFNVPNLLGRDGRPVDLPAGRRWRAGQLYDSVVIPAAQLPETHADFKFFTGSGQEGGLLFTNRTSNESISKDTIILADTFFARVVLHNGNVRAIGADIVGIMESMVVSVKLGTQGDILIREPAVHWPGGYGLTGSDQDTQAAVITNGAPSYLARRLLEVPILLDGSVDTLDAEVQFPRPAASTKYTRTAYTAYTPTAITRWEFGFAGVVSP